MVLFPYYAILLQLVAVDLAGLGAGLVVAELVVAELVVAGLVVLDPSFLEAVDLVELVECVELVFLVALEFLEDELPYVLL